MGLNRHQPRKKPQAIKPDPAIKIQETATLTELLRIQRETTNCKDACEAFAAQAATHDYNTATSSAAVSAMRDEIYSMHEEVMNMLVQCQRSERNALAHKKYARRYLDQCAKKAKL